METSEPNRNNIMDHKPNSDTFQGHYLAVNVSTDIQAKMLGTTPQKELMKQATSHGGSIDVRRPINLTADQAHALQSDPQYVRLTTLLYSLPKGSPDRPEVERRRKNLMASLRRKAIEWAREDWKASQAVEDIERQLEGHGFAPQVARDVARASRPLVGAQLRMLTALEAPPPRTFDVAALNQRRGAAIEALMAYCVVEEALSMSNKMMEARPAPEIAKLPQKETDPLRLAQMIRASAFGRVGKVHRCFVCVAKALTLYPDDPNVDVLLRWVERHDSLTRHFVLVHLRNIATDATGQCPLCPDVHLNDKMHLQQHAEVVHGIRTPSAKKMSS